MVLQSSIFASKWFSSLKRVVGGVLEPMIALLPKGWIAAVESRIKSTGPSNFQPLVLDAKEMFHLSITLPIVQKKVVEEVIAYQIESKLPFPVKECVYSILHQVEREKELVVYVAVISLKNLKEQVERIEQIEQIEQTSQKSQSKNKNKNCVALSPAKALHAFHRRVKVDSLGMWKPSAVSSQSNDAIYLLLDSQRKSLWVVYMGCEGMLRNHLIPINPNGAQDPKEQLEPLSREIKRTLLSWSIPLDHHLYSYGFDVGQCDCFGVHGLKVLSLRSSLSESPLEYGASHLLSFNPLKEDFLTLGSVALLPSERRLFSVFIAKMAVTASIALCLYASANYSKELILTYAAQKDVQSRLASTSFDGKALPPGRGLAQWKDWVAKRTAPYDVEPKLPNIGETMSWVGQSVRKVREKEKVDTLSVVLEEFHYEMESYPSLEKKSRPYRLKLDLQMSATDPSVIEHVRRELLRAPWVDKSKKVLWNPVGHNGYRMTLYLKPLRK